MHSGPRIALSDVKAQSGLENSRRRSGEALSAVSRMRNDHRSLSVLWDQLRVVVGKALACVSGEDASVCPERGSSSCEFSHTADLYGNMSVALGRLPPLTSP